ncbi:hypothetical protein JYQ62_31000 [Nostoc sp. UHCC 0702]|nr:hypothetical protein JYQ62_31000 [Nostoc sp. UHCC 0702]
MALPMDDFNSFPNNCEWLRQINIFLQNVRELTELFGKEWVDNLLQRWFTATAPDSSSSSADINASNAEPAASGADMIGNVELLGLELNPQLINLIAQSTVEQVKTAIAKYKTYRQVTNPEGLFYRILSNEGHK